MRKRFHICGFRKGPQRLKLKTNISRRTKNRNFMKHQSLKNIYIGGVSYRLAKKNKIIYSVIGSSLFSPISFNAGETKINFISGVKVAPYSFTIPRALTKA